MRIYWKHIDNWSEEDMHIFLRCDEFSLEDTLKLLALTKKVDYVRAASDPIAPSMKYCYSEFVLGDEKTGQLDHVNIYLEDANF